MFISFNYSCGPLIVCGGYWLASVSCLNAKLFKNCHHWATSIPLKYHGNFVHLWISLHNITVWCVMCACNSDNDKICHSSVQVAGVNRLQSCTGSWLIDWY